MNTLFSVQEVADLSEFHTLKIQWDRLADKQGAFAAFLCFDWFKVWFEHFPPGKLLILLLWRNNQIEAIAPFQMSEVKYRGIKVKRIELIGNVYSPIRYFLFYETDRTAREKNLIHIFQHLQRASHDWQILDLYAIPEENNSYEIVKKAINECGLNYLEYSCFGDWYLNEIEFTGDEYFASLPKRIIKDVQYCQRRLEKMGDFQFQVIRDGAHVDHYMNLYYEVYSRSWQEKEHIGPMFHLGLARMAARKGWLRLGFLMLNDLPISSQLWLTCNGTSFILKTVYDQAYKKYSAGKILTVEMMKYVIDKDKVNTIDYMHGDESYKQYWTPKRRERKGLIVYNKNVKGTYLSILNNNLLPIFNKYPYLKQAKAFVSNHWRKNQTLQ